MRRPSAPARWSHRGRTPTPPRPDGAAADAPPSAAAVELILRFARAAHHAGYTTADVEDRVLALAGALGVVGVQISSTPTLIEISLGPLSRARSHALRVRPAPVDLDAIARLDGLVDDVLDDQLDVATTLIRLREIEAHPLRRPWPVIVAAYSLAGAALTPVLGGGARETVAGGAVGLVVGIVVLLTRPVLRTDAMIAPVAAAAAGFCASTIGALGGDISPDIVSLAAVVTLLPGMTLTVGMQELATEDLQSGVANTANALVQLLGLVFGVGIGHSLALSWFGQASETVPSTAFHASHVAAAAAAGVAFSVTLRASRRAIPLMCAATVLALLANATGRVLFGPAAGVFAAAVAVGVAGGLLAMLARRSPLVFIVPGVLMLVPGSAGFESLQQLLAGQTVSGIDAGFDTFVTAMSIAYGLMLSTVIIPRRFTSLSQRR